MWWRIDRPLIRAPEEKATTSDSCLLHCLIKVFIFFMMSLVLMCAGFKRLQEQ
ncbi:hypothetical protein HMPREF9056_00541 [Actinomyces sp. oral taxon 170 str. F0386]|nr:hypothetical protein HMPREF9056_00541 [Actinomyces sp. oral taxon 170 str. F0386]